MRKRFKALDLFCGCGGLSVGLKSAGFQVLGAIDYDHTAISSYKVNHPNVKTWNMDIRNLAGDEIRNELRLSVGELDLLAGCPPCQGFSTLRTKNGSIKTEDEKNDLIFEFIRLVEQLKPKTILVENVPGLATDARMQEVKFTLTKLGYYVDDTCIKVLNAADYGVPQRRKRMVMIASKFGFIKSVEKFRIKLTVRDAIFNLPVPGNSGDPLHDLLNIHSEEVLTRIKKIPKNGGSRKDLPVEDQLPCHKKIDGFKNIYGRMRWEDVAPTITSGCTTPSKGRFLHPEQDRAITLREAALLQGFPKDYYISLERGKTNASLQIGNAIPPRFVESHARRIYKHLLQS